MAVKKINKKLKAILSNESTNWQEKANWRKENQSWLKHSQRIAIQINKILKERKLTQKKLAKMLNVSPQQVSKIMKGRENLTLETIAKIEEVLSIRLITFPIISSTSFEDLNPQKIGNQ